MSKTVIFVEKAKAAKSIANALNKDFKLWMLENNIHNFSEYRAKQFVRAVKKEETNV